MIRVFKPTDRDFTSNGDAVIVPIKARVKNNMNGEFFIELTCESKFYKYLDQGNIIITPTPQGEQAFRIDNQLSRKGERITIKARHVFYDAEKLVVADSYAVDLNCEQALKHFNAATDSTSPFTMHSDITSLNSFRCVRKSLAEAVGTVIERWGGYLVRNNWDISVNKSVGRDYGVTIRYAKNLKELTASYDFSGVATKLLPVGKDGILLPELYVSSVKQYSIPYTKVVSIQQDINEDDYSTEEEYQAAVIADLRTQAQALVNKTCIPVITYTLKGNPEKVQDIGDVIEVIDERIGVNITTQVIGYEWDVITEQYASLTFGNFGNTLSGLMAKVNADTKGVVNEAVGEVKTEFKSSINNIYDLLQGSYVFYRGYDILLLDRIPAGTAQNVIKFSKDGISVSSDGINGDFKEVYNIATKKLSVPSISLNGKDLQNTLDDKISYDNLKEGNNITITRKGKIITINSTGGDGGIRLYYGADIPANSFGSNKDIYIQLDTAMANLLAFDASYSGTSTTNYTATETNRKWDITATFLDNWEYHSFVIYSLQNLTVGKKYTISFDFQNDGIPPLYGVGELFGLTLQHSNQFIDMRNWSSDLVENGAFKYFETSYYGEWWYQSFPNDTKRVHYEFEFTARQTTEYIGFYGDRTSGELTCSLYELCVGDKEVTNKIKDVFYKINDEWLKYNGGTTYEAGDHITIEDDVISANYSPFTGATAEQAGAAGLVPAPAVTDVDKVLGAGGNWVKKGAEVEANPADSASGTLTKLGVDGTVYEIQGGGGGGLTYFGVFVDANNVIQPFINVTDTQIHTYTAIKDCAVAYYIPNDTNTDVFIKLDGIQVGGQYGEHINATSGIVYMKKGQVFTYQSTYTASSGAGYTVYGLQSGSETRFFQPIIYSTEEREVGVGENNKPLYQKTIESGFIPADSVVTTGLTNIESYHVIAIEMINISNNAEFSPSSISMYNYQGADTNYGTIYFNNNELQFVNNSRVNAIKIRAVIQYTKTTDTAGSGNYTTLGVPAHHYDGNEKIIGTWFGATLYEKTINTTVAPPYSSIDLSSLNINEITHYEGYAKDSSGNSIPVGYSVASGAQYLVTSFEKATSTFYISVGSGLSIYNNVFLTIQYTKNT
jgi:phage minor structural protein